MNSRVLILLAGDLVDFPISHREWDVIIAADGGVTHCLKQNVMPDHIIGDFDSISPEDKNLVQGKSRFWIYPMDKDYTDGELAVEKAIEMNPKEAVIAGGLGKRFDHSLTNVFLLKLLADHSVSAYLTDGKEKVYFLTNSLQLDSLPGQRISLIPLSNPLEVKKATGLKWPLHNDVLYFGSGRGLSNRATSNRVCLEISSGTALVIQALKDD
jgi:thiamine pyrophosphokinase